MPQPMLCDTTGQLPRKLRRRQPGTPVGACAHGVDMTDIDTLAAALGDGYRLIDHDEFWQIVRTDGEHVAITKGVKVAQAAGDTSRLHSRGHRLSGAALVRIRQLWLHPDTHTHRTKCHCCLHTTCVIDRTSIRAVSKLGS